MSSSVTSTPTSADLAISLRIVATPPRVASRRGPDPGRAVEQPGHQPVQRGGVGQQVSFDVQLTAGQHDRDAMVADRAGHDDRVARLGLRHPQRDVPLEDTHAGRVDVAAVGLAALDDLGVAGDDLHPGRGRRVPHRFGDPAQVGDRETLLQDEPGRLVLGRGPAHGQVVDRAVDGQLADVPAGEEQRRDHVGVGGQRDPGRAGLERGRVLQRFQQRVAEGVQEHRLDQRVRGLAAGAVRHRYAFLAHLGTAAPGLVDPVQDLLLPV